MREKYRENVLWGILLLIVGVFLLLERLEVFGPVQFPTTPVIFFALTLAFLVLYFWGGRHWPLLIPGFTFLGLSLLTLNGLEGWLPGELGAGMLLFCIGMPFLIGFFEHPENWGLLIPGGILFFVGVAIALSAYLHPSFVSATLFWGMGITFFFVFLVKNSNWWAIIPGGILSTIGFLPPLTALWGVTSAGWVGGLLCAGLAGTFGLVYLVDPKLQTRWALYPFGFLLFLALCFVFFGELAAKWWPLLLIVLGLYLLVINLLRRNRSRI